MGKERTCCFTGHRHLSGKKIEQIMINLNREIDILIDKGVRVFLSGGAVGFDQIAASLIVAKKEMGFDIKLIFVLPCKDQDKKWSYEQKKLYHNLLQEADQQIILSEEYYDGCMKDRNCYMVDHSAYCICALTKERSGTGQTVRYARSQGLQVKNVVPTGNEPLSTPYSLSS